MIPTIGQPTVEATSAVTVQVTARPALGSQVASARPRPTIAAPCAITSTGTSHATPTFHHGVLRSMQDSVTSAGQNASQKTRRDAPHHFPQTIDEVRIGVDSRTSRLPRTRSSLRTVPAEALSRSSPTRTWKAFRIAALSLPILGPGPIGFIHRSQITLRLKAEVSAM